MIIKFSGAKQIKKGKHDFWLIRGINTYNDEEYSRDFPAWEDELVSQLEQFSPGDLMNIQFKKDKYKNIESMTPTDESAIKKSSAPKKPAKGSNKFQPRTDGTTRGEDTNRSAAIYLAQKVCEVEGVQVFDNNLLFMLADKIFAYITEGKHPEKPESDLDAALEPPDVEDKGE